MNKIKPGSLFLIPTPLGSELPHPTIPEGQLSILDSIQVFIVEELRTARRYLKSAGISSPIDSLTFFELNEHTLPEETGNYLSAALEGKDIGLLSEAGLPCVADPGNIIVRMAHAKGIPVVPLVGPSSVMLALMASGFNGQAFTFHGYLPVKPDERVRSLRAIDKELRASGKTQIFIETPYRNNALLESILSACNPQLHLCIALDLTTSSETIISKPLSKWTKEHPELHKRPAVFLLGT